MANITPSKEGYRRALKMIITYSTSQEDVDWALNELKDILMGEKE